MADAAKPEKLTLAAAIKDLGWFPLTFAVTVGGPSILAILESVFVDHQLVPALQWIVDGYNRVMAVLGAVVEPLLQPAIDWLNARLNWALMLDPIWRPLFALQMVLVLGYARTGWRDRARVGVALGIGFGALLGAVLAGIVPNDGGWWGEGLRAAVPTASLLLLWVLTRAAFDLARGDAAAASVFLRSLPVLVLPLLMFVLAADLSSVPGLPAAAVLTLGWMVSVFGVGFLAGGLWWRGGRFQTRLGLTILGGFVAAGLILGADFALKALGAG